MSQKTTGLVGLGHFRPAPDGGGAAVADRGRKTSIKNPGRIGSSSLAGNHSRGKKTPKTNPVKATLTTNQFMEYNDREGDLFTASEDLDL